MATRHSILLAGVTVLAIGVGSAGAWTAHRAIQSVEFFQSEALKWHGEAKNLKASLSVARGQLADAERRIAEAKKGVQPRAGRPGTVSYRANSWMNVKAPSDRYWKGQCGRDRQKHAIWVAPEYSLRAGAFVLRSYFLKHKISTVEGIVKRFSTKNHDEYISYVCKRMNLKPDESFDVIRRMPELIRFMSEFETGRPVPDHLLATLDILGKI